MAEIVASIAVLVLFALAVVAVALIIYSVVLDRAESRQRIQRRLDRL